jgi:hypothetical protein
MPRVRKYATCGACAASGRIRSPSGPEQMQSGFFRFVTTATCATVRVGLRCEWPRGGMITQRPAKPCTLVQFQAWPPTRTITCFAVRYPAHDVVIKRYKLRLILSSFVEPHFLHASVRAWNFQPNASGGVLSGCDRLRVDRKDFPVYRRVATMHHRSRW